MRAASRIDPDWSGEVLDLFLPVEREGGGQLAVDLVKHLARNADRSRLGQLLQSGRHVHPVSVNVPVVLDDDVPEVDAHTEPQGLPRTFRSPTRTHRLLYLQGTANGIQRAPKLD